LNRKVAEIAEKTEGGQCSVFSFQHSVLSSVLGGAAGRRLFGRGELFVYDAVDVDVPHTIATIEHFL
jgi:hypothetical protein